MPFKAISAYYNEQHRAQWPSPAEQIPCRPAPHPTSIALFVFYMRTIDKYATCYARNRSSDICFAAMTPCRCEKPTSCKDPTKLRLMNSAITLNISFPHLPALSRVRTCSHPIPRTPLSSPLLTSASRLSSCCGHRTCISSPTGRV